ncbi:hypothetical protein FS749_004268 [Ceratobasidium sp. UAMH 11750]|nr:hypothetical protein FS749_004268 [Ceratobasidium sp. UAMH 11750]
MRQSGQSLFARPRDIDLSLPTHHDNQTTTRLDIDLDEDDIPDWGSRSTGGREVVFDAGPNGWTDAPPVRKPNPNIGMNRGDPGESEDLWASM